VDDRVSHQHRPRGEVPAGFHPSYWHDAEDRDKRRINVYKHFVRPGDLAFDIGANVGEVTHVLLGLGCRVVAVEPQTHVAAYIPSEAVVVVAACGSQVGEAPIFEVPNNPYLTTLRRDIADAAVGTNASWASVERVTPVVTLDALIAEHGLPAFCKIDVEGFEAEVLRGLSQPLPALSFEAHSFDTAKVGACVELLDRLGEYGYLYSPGEGYELGPWPPVAYQFFGDVYATLRSGRVDVEEMVLDSHPSPW
jgi:FkbM family methyltransferase